MYDGQPEKLQVETDQGLFQNSPSFKLHFADIEVSRFDAKIEPLSYTSRLFEEAFLQTIGNFTIGTTASARQSPYEKARGFGEQIDRGYMPLLGNNFAFVIDTRPEGHEDDYISAREYTEYFSNGQIPIAAAGHRLREHDLTHIFSYQTMFRSSALAEFVRTTAASALQDDEQFDHRGIDRTSVNAVSFSLSKMQQLHIVQGATNPDNVSAVIEQIKQDLLIPHYEQVSTYRKRDNEIPLLSNDHYGHLL